MRGAAGGRHPPRRSPRVHVIIYIYIDMLYAKYNFPESQTALHFPQVLGLRAREQLVIVLRPFFCVFPERRSALQFTHRHSAHPVSVLIRYLLTIQYVLLESQTEVKRDRCPASLELCR